MTSTVLVMFIHYSNHLRLPLKTWRKKTKDSTLASLTKLRFMTSCPQGSFQIQAQFLYERSSDVFAIEV